MWNRLRSRLTCCAVAALAGSACSINPVEVPRPIGPSEFALAYQVAASPDNIRHDGIDSSRIVVTARDANGRPTSGLAVRLDILVQGVPTEYGRLSNRTIVTGSDGTARATYTAPAPGPINAPIGTCAASGEVLLGSCVVIVATAIGNSSYGDLPSQSAQIHLVPPSLLLPPAEPSAPVASFLYAPSVPRKGTVIQFSAEGSKANAGRRLVQYRWSWGDGQSATRPGPLEDHDYVEVGYYPVVLTVVDEAGVSGSMVQIINVVP
jgi:PKD repeat protein